jgi:hypothetical protein
MRRLSVLGAKRTRRAAAGPEDSPPRRLAGGAVLLIGRLQGGMVALAEQVVRAHRTLLWHACCRDAIASIHEGRVSMVLCERSLPDGDWSLIQRTLRRLSDPPPLVVVLPEDNPRFETTVAPWSLCMDGPPLPAA